MFFDIDFYMFLFFPGKSKTNKPYVLGNPNSSKPSKVIELGGGSKKLNKSDDDLQILEEIPGKSGMGGTGMNSFSSLLGSGGSVRGGSNPFFNTPSLLQAQDPYFSLNSLQAGSSSAANSMDILQKCKFFQLYFLLLDTLTYIYLYNECFCVTTHNFSN